MAQKDIAKDWEKLDNSGEIENIKMHVGKPSVKAIISFIIALVLCYTLIGVSIINKSNIEKLKMEQLISKKSALITDVISKLLYKTQMLAAIVMQGNGDVDNFERIAAMIVDDPAILNVLIAPKGVVSDVYPLHGNEAVIGLDYFSEGAGNREAILAMETKELVFGGPFNLVQGGQALVGRMPVFLTSDNGEKEFWGLVSVTLKYPQALSGANLSEIEEEGLCYEIWRINPDDGTRQSIAIGDNGYNYDMVFIEKDINILNANWTFRIAPVKDWYGYLENWLLLIVGLGMSLLVAYMTQYNHMLSIMKKKLEKMARVDSLTMISNRRHFIEFSLAQLEKVARTGSECYVILFDIDKFKDINDSYGHPAGDDVLKHMSSRIKNSLRPYDMFARYGGEEFILLITDIDNDEVMKFAERLRKSVSDKPIKTGSKEIYITASFGIAAAAPEYDLELVISKADKALYIAKEQGRNRVVRYYDSLDKGHGD